MSLELMGKVKACAEAVPSAERSIVATRLLGRSVCLSVYLHLQVTYHIKLRLAVRPRHHKHFHVIFIELNILFSFITHREELSGFNTATMLLSPSHSLPPPSTRHITSNYKQILSMSLEIRFSSKWNENFFIWGQLRLLHSIRTSLNIHIWNCKRL